MNDEKHLRELIQAALDGKPLEFHWTPTEWISAPNNIIKILIRNITSAPLSYRIKPEVKTFTYQTRVYMVNETIRVWVRADCLNKKELEECSAPQWFKWLAPAQTHTIEYTE
jgi:hypothetical protein